MGKCPVCHGQQFIQDPHQNWHYCWYCKGEGSDPGTPKFKVYKFPITLTALQLLPNQRIVINGNAPFRIKLLTRTKTGDFRIRLFTSEAGAYSSSGEGGTNDRVRDTCMFGDGSLPFLVVPHIDISVGGYIGFDLEDVSNANNSIELAFIGEEIYPTK